MGVGIQEPELGSPQGSFDSALSWSAELNVPETESLIRAIERILQDLGASYMLGSVATKILGWQRLVDLAQRDRPAIGALRALTFDLLVRLAHNASGPQLATFARQMSSLAPSVEGSQRDLSPDDARQALTFAAKAVSVDDALVSEINSLISEGQSGTAVAQFIRQRTSQQTRSYPTPAIPEVPLQARYDEMSNAPHRLHLSVRISSPLLSVGSLGSVLWALGSAIESVDGVIANVEHVSSGSVVVDVGLFARSVFRLDDVFEILERAFDKVGGAPPKRMLIQANEEDALRRREEDTEAARQRIEEKERAFQQATTAENAKFPAASGSELGATSAALDLAQRQLELERQAYEVEKARLETAEQRLKYMATVSDMLARGILEVDSATIAIEDYPIFRTEERRVVLRDTRMLEQIRKRELGTGGEGGPSLPSTDDPKRPKVS
jgi:hypothetical protein